MSFDTATGGPGVGTIVHYRLDSGLHHGEDRPAMIVRVALPAPEPEAEEVREEAPVLGADGLPLAVQPVETPAQEAAEPAPEKEVLVDLLVFTLGLEDFAAGTPGSDCLLPRVGIRNDPTSSMPNHWHALD
jgi:hypothetical protein